MEFRAASTITGMQPRHSDCWLYETEEHGGVANGERRYIGSYITTWGALDDDVWRIPLRTGSSCSEKIYDQVPATPSHIQLRSASFAEGVWLGMSSRAEQILALTLELLMLFWV
ncbi:conserved hypothetical protein [Coccidioides posadasii str. Silveira]|uniref:Uncharacterized protein n=1 Tax=Coccidioides posadasii (strain RMSCC 757 / Silveira) TaxID=443226 RepID=E9DHU6_COCPS|nr:conserved hypothetical protein [Coccidioides posadasii str. Silveira]